MNVGVYDPSHTVFKRVRRVYSAPGQLGSDLTVQCVTNGGNVGLPLPGPPMKPQE